MVHIDNYTERPDDSTVLSTATNTGVYMEYSSTLLLAFLQETEPLAYLCLYHLGR